MREAVGNAFIFTIVGTFVGIVLLIVISSIVYTKAFRIKNRIVDIIERYQVYDEAVDDIDNFLVEAGYMANNFSDNSDCNSYGVGDNLANPSSLHHYCVLEFTSGKSGGYYYKVVTFAYLDIPLVNAIQIPVSGETKIFYPQ